MSDLGIDPSDRTPLLTTDLAGRADVVITIGCGDECPYIPSQRYVDRDLPDPAGRTLEDVRAIRDDIRRRIDALVAET